MAKKVGTRQTPTIDSLQAEILELRGLIDATTRKLGDEQCKVSALVSERDVLLGEKLRLEVECATQAGIIEQAIADVERMEKTIDELREVLGKLRSIPFFWPAHRAASAVAAALRVIRKR